MSSNGKFIILFDGCRKTVVLIDIDIVFFPVSLSEFFFVFSKTEN